MTSTPTPHPRTPEQVRASQAAQQELDRAMRAGVRPPVTPGQRPNPPPTRGSNTVSVAAGTTAPAAPDNIPDTRNPVTKFLDEAAPPSIVGSPIKFAKGEFTNEDTGEAISPEEDFIVLADETLVGWIRFHRDGETPPTRIQGILYDGFIPPPRASLGDNDKETWPIGLSGKPEDPWKMQFSLVLQEPQTLSLFTFRTVTDTGVKSVARLLKHYDRMKQKDNEHYPVVRLKVGGFQHRDERVGWVPTPTFAIVGKAPKASAAVLDTSPSADMEDEIPFN